MKQLLGSALGACLAAVAFHTAWAAPFVYVASGNAGTIAVVDAANNTLAATVTLEPGLRAVAVNRRGTVIYAAGAYGGSLVVWSIDALTNKVVSRTPVPKAASPQAVTLAAGGIAINASATRVYAISEGYDLAVVDTATNSVIARANAGSGAASGGVAINPEGTRVYVADWFYGDLHVVDAETYKHLAQVSLVMMIEGVATSSDGSRIYVADSCCYVWVVDARSLEVATKIPVDGGPYRLALGADGKWLYVSIPGRNAIARIDTATNAVLGEVNVGNAPAGVAVDSAGLRIYVANSGSDDLSVVDAATFSVVGTINVGRAPTALATGPAKIVADPAVTVVEFYHAALDHYFITWRPDEIAELDSGTRIKGWLRTGHGFRALTTPATASSPVCRFYIPPPLGDSHFFGRGTFECEATARKNPSFVAEDYAFMEMFLPDRGECPSGTTEVHRVFSNRPDANHRYTVDKSVLAKMVASGWLAEGDGADLVVMCAPQ